jgi:hypothetical protein
VVLSSVAAIDAVVADVVLSSTCSLSFVWHACEPGGVLVCAQLFSLAWCVVVSQALIMHLLVQTC